MTILDIELIEHLDFDFIPPCERENCAPHKAEYKVIFACCAYTMLWCEPCYSKIEGYIAMGEMFHCESCGTSNIVKPFAVVEKLKV